MNHDSFWDDERVQELLKEIEYLKSISIECICGDKMKCNQERDALRAQVELLKKQINEWKQVAEAEASCCDDRLKEIEELAMEVERLKLKVKR